MEPQVLGQANIANTLNGYTLHAFIEKNKEKVAEGSLLLLEGTDGQLFIKVASHDYVKPLKGAVFVVVKYAKSTSFLYFHQGNKHVVYAASTLNNNDTLPTLIDTLAHQSELLDYTNPALPYEVKIRIDFHIDAVANNEVIINYNRISKIAKSIGSFFGSISTKATQIGEATEKGYQEKLRASRDSFSEENRNRWQKFKDGTSYVNEKMTETIKPAKDYVLSWRQSIGESYKNSSNTFIQAFRQMTKQTEESLNQAYLDPEVANNPQPKDENDPANTTNKSMLKEGLTAGDDS